MNYNHLKNRTDEILRERIRLGMTGGVRANAYHHRRHLLGERGHGIMRASGVRAGARRRVGRGVIVGGVQSELTKAKLSFKRATTEAGRDRAGNRLYDILSTKARLTPTQLELFNEIDSMYGENAGPKVKKVRKGRSGSKTRKEHCESLKTLYGRKVCRRQVRDNISHKEAAEAFKKDPIAYEKYKIKLGKARRAKNASLKGQPCDVRDNKWLVFLCKYRAAHKGEYVGREGQKQLLRDASLEYHGVEYGEGYSHHY
jgi:hypothetical protein